MKLLILSYYYYPDMSAGSFRIKSVVDSLVSLQNLNPDLEIDLVCSSPNRYKNYRPKIDDTKKEKINIKRIPVNKHSSGIIAQSIAFLIFAIGVLKTTKNHEYDIIFASSSRLMTAALAAFLSKKNNTLLYLDIRDIFLDTINNIYKSKIFFFIKYVFKKIEIYTIKQASHINLVSEGFKKYFISYYPLQSFSFYSNGIDSMFENLPAIQNKNEKIKILYAGNIGEGQGLDKIIPDLILNLPENYHFLIIGNGGKINNLKDKLLNLDIKNYEIIAPMKQKDLVKKYLEADILFLHLNKYDAFLKVLPSKIFEYAATHKPICAGVDGYSRNFLLKNVSNCSVFEPCNVKEARKCILNMDLKVKKRTDFIEKFRRNRISTLIAKDILEKYERNLS